MNSYEAEPACPKAGAVLAIHLDGDVDASGFGFVCGETLSIHLSECTSCQLLLQRARRLDAVLASTAGRTLLDHTADGGASLDAAAQRWFATATASAAITAPTKGPAAEVRPQTQAAGTSAVETGTRSTAGDTDPRQRVASYAAAACLLAGALVAVLLLASHAHTIMAPSMTPVAVATPNVPTPRVPTPDVPTPNVPTTEPATPPEPQPQATAETPATGLVIADDAVVRARRGPRRAEEDAVPSVAELHRRVADAGTAQSRLAAARVLFAACQPFSPDAKNATRALVDALAGLGDRSAAERLLHRHLLGIARSTPHLLAWLQSRLLHLDAPIHVDARGEMDRFDLAVLTVAARLQERDLDLAIRRVVRRAPGVAAALAAALRCGLRENGAGALLLDAWHDLAARGVLADDQDAAWSWFGGQAPRVFDELQHELRTSRSAPRRLRCVLGLGCAADDSTVPMLLELLQGNDHAEAHAAAFALAGLPHRCLRALLPRATANEGSFLLRAALARAALPETRSWPFVMALTAGEQQLLSRATLAQFPVVAGWFRDRSTALSD